MSLLTLVKILIGLQRLINLIIDEIAKRNAKGELLEVKAALDEYRLAETIEAKRASLAKLETLF
jgi:hypothetical protein